MTVDEEARIQSKTIANEDEKRARELYSLIQNLDIDEAEVVAEALVNKYPIILFKKLEEGWINKETMLKEIGKIYGMG